MLFEIVRNGKILARTKNVDCIEDNAILKQMKENGYIFRIDGKAVSLKEIKVLKMKTSATEGSVSNVK